MEEIMEILKMVKEGKLSPEDAAKLIEKIKKREKESLHTGIFETIFTTIGNVFDTVSSVFHSFPEFVGAKFGRKIEEHTITLTPSDKIRIRVTGGDVYINTSPDKEMKFYGRITHTKRDAEKVIIDAIEDLKVEIPKVKNLDIMITGGDLSGNLITDRLTAEIMGGDVSLSLKEINSGSLHCVGGDINLKLGENLNLQIDALARFGEVMCDLPLTFDIKEENRIKGILGEKKGELNLRTTGGDITIEKV